MSLLKSATLTFLFGAVLVTSSTLNAGPRFAGGEITFRGTGQISTIDRVSPRADSSSDIIYAAIPGISYNKDTGTKSLNVDFEAPIRRYDENKQLASNSIRFNVRGEVPFGTGPRLSGNWTVSYFEGIQSNYLVNRNLDTERFAANTYIDFALRSRLSFRARANYQDRSSNGVEDTFTNANTSTLLAAGLHYRDLIRGRIGVYLEYVVRDRDTDRGAFNQNVDARDDGFNIGITGQILPENLFPKLEADLSFGLVSTDAGGDNNRNRLTLDGRLSYPANPKTNVSLNYSRNILITDDDRTIEQSDLDLSVNYTPRPKLSFATSVGVRSNDFLSNNTDREDDVFTASVSARYVLRPYWFASLAHNLRDSSSNVAISDYSSAQTTLSSTISF